MNEPIYAYDPASALENEESIAVFLADALETNEQKQFLHARSLTSRRRDSAGFRRVRPNCVGIKVT